MAKTISDIKAVSNDLAKRAKLGQTDLKALTGVVNDLVNHVHAASGVTEDTKIPAPEVKAAPKTLPAPEAAAPAIADVVAPKRGRRKGVTVGNQAPAAPKVTVGTPAANPADAKPATEGTTTRTIPHRLKAGCGVTVGTPSPINNGVTVGSAPVNPAGLVTVGGRPRK